MKNLNLLLPIFVVLTMGAFGVSKSDQANWAFGLNQEKLALFSNNNKGICSLENKNENISLFVSCAGFLE